MLRDLARDTPPSDGIDTGVAILGGGIAGFVLARRLTDLGVAYVMLESGARDEAPAPDRLFANVEFVRRTYGGVTKGRARCLGGTSVKWGGAMIPFRGTDLTARLHLGHAEWPVDAAELQAQVPLAEHLFGLDHTPYKVDFEGQIMPLDEPRFLPREAKWPTFRNRNVTVLFRDILENDGDTEPQRGQQIWMNATAGDFDVQDGHLRAVTGLGPSGQRLTVRAQQVVVTAGAIETTRLMLLLDRQTDGRILAGREHLGRYFQDHLSIPLARIETDAPDRLNAFLGFRFDGPVMRSLRFERAVVGGAAGFVHVAPRPLGPTGFDAVRDLMRAVQRRHFDTRAFLRTFAHLPYMVRLAWWRFVKGRLLWPSPAAYDLHVVIEQPALAGNRIVLGARCDALGYPVTVLDWDIGAPELEIFREVCVDFDAYWQDSGLVRYGRLRWQAPPAALGIEALEAVDDIYHPVGTTRMATDAGGGVVDRDLRVFGIDNLSLAATSVLPSGGSANPTMTLILLTLRLADRLAGQLGQVQPDRPQSHQHLGSGRHRRAP